jgi:hypothetical protein
LMPSTVSDFVAAMPGAAAIPAMTATPAKAVASRRARVLFRETEVRVI